ncbi:E3 SUMO-protein ligase KIAA1586-like [Rhopalosiphum padi]|uniref:E3 SUMO-protein ligase KIAA1586-like n=1 Tax=Rhopalosiphum padi TaxID=40932 RepID=UPI00298E6C3F|nr:E3 SUMO-protein ligase KIAA1586-like [Rhopalosiphum padi]
MLSCILQSRKTTLMRAQSEINRTIRILESLKAEPGEKEKEIIEAIQKGINKGVNITMTKSGGINRLQFLQNLVDRMRQRLFDDSKNKTMLEDIQVIDEVFKVAINDAKGEDEVKRVSRTLGFSKFESVVDFRSRNVFSSFMKALNILPTSTADCERGFSDMNLTITDLRTSLNIENVSDLMFISINGPSIADFNPRPYIKIWLRDHRSAVSTPRGKERKEIDDENKMQKLFFNNIDFVTLERQSCILACTDLPENTYTIRDQVVSTIADNGSNFVKAFKEFGCDFLDENDTDNDDKY